MKKERKTEGQKEKGVGGGRVKRRKNDKRRGIRVGHRLVFTPPHQLHLQRVSKETKLLVFRRKKKKIKREKSEEGRK